MAGVQTRILFPASKLAAFAALAFSVSCATNPNPAPELSTLPNSHMRATGKMKPSNPHETATTVDPAAAAAATGGNSMPERVGEQPIGKTTAATRSLGKSSPGPGLAGGSQVPASTASSNNLIPQVTANPSVSSPNGVEGVTGTGAATSTLGVTTVVAGSTAKTVNSNTVRSPAAAAATTQPGSRTSAAVGTSGLTTPTLGAQVGVSTTSGAAAGLDATLGGRPSITNGDGTVTPSAVGAAEVSSTVSSPSVKKTTTTTTKKKSKVRVSTRSGQKKVVVEKDIPKK